MKKPKSSGSRHEKKGPKEISPGEARAQSRKGPAALPQRGPPPDLLAAAGIGAPPGGIGPPSVGSPAGPDPGMTPPFRRRGGY
jgi:hypothetical protein